MAGRKSTFDTKKALELLKKGLKYREIASLLNVKESTLKMFYRRHAKEEIKKRKEKKHIKNCCDECHYVYREKPLMPCESISTEAFIKTNRQSYVTDKETGELKFDKTRGGATKDLPLRYHLKN